MPGRMIDAGILFNSLKKLYDDKGYKYNEVHFSLDDMEMNLLSAILETVKRCPPEEANRPCQWYGVHDKQCYALYTQTDCHPSVECCGDKCKCVFDWHNSIEGCLCRDSQA